jgi:peptidoglycan/xylan/chitin deacetylase (PgdA/CDA1 family)
MAAFIGTWIVAPRQTLSGTVFSTAVELPRRGDGVKPPVLQLRRVRLAPYVAQPHNIYGLGGDWQVSFTFDDGPHRIHTPRLLKLLDKHDVKATFFINGYWLDPTYRFGRKNQQILLMAHQNGHTIGNHTYSHALLPQMTHQEQKEEVVANHQLISSVTGHSPKLFRPPYGVMTRYARTILSQYGYVEALWSATAPDQEIQDPHEIRDIVMGWLRAYKGGTVMLHDRHVWSIEAVRLILEALSRENCRRIVRNQPLYRIVPLDSFLKPPPQSWALRRQDELKGDRRHFCN